MASRGRGRRSGGQSNNQSPPTFYQRALMEAISDANTTIMEVSVVATTITQASETVS